MMLTGKTYDVSKFIALVVLPAIGTLYFTLAGIWGLPAAEEVVGTIVAVDTFLGVVLQISSSGFNNATVGQIRMVPTPTGGTSFNLELEGDPEEELATKSKAIFDVIKEPE